MRSPDSTATAAVLVGVDGGDAALCAVRWAAVYAEAIGATLRLMHAVPTTVSVRAMVSTALHLDTDLVDAQDRDAHRYLVEATRVAHGVAPEVVVDTRISADSIVPHVGRCSAATRLVVVAARTTSAASNILCGDHAIEVARVSRVPVLAWRPESASAIVRGAVVIGLDGSDRDRDAVDAGFEMASVLQTRVIAARFGETAAVSRRGADRALCDRFLGVEYESITELRDPTRALQSLSFSAQVIVVGSRRRARRPGVMLGAVTRHLIRHAGCSVLVV